MDQSSPIAGRDLFKAGTVNILCCSDVAARGLDVKGVSHVFNFDTPWHPDYYVHRIGRTGRAGATGRAFTFVAPEDAEAIENVEKLTGGKIPVFDVALDGGSESAERPRREPREEHAEKPRRERAARPPRESEERAPRAERASRSEPAPRAERPAPEPRSAEPARPRRSEPAEPPSAPGEWNGPVPGFLGVTLG